MNNHAATLLYKCRLCGGLDKSTHVPHGPIALMAIEGISEWPGAWFGVRPTATSTHICPDGKHGVTDIAGFEYEKLDEI